LLELEAMGPIQLLRAKLNILKYVLCRPPSIYLLHSR